VVRRRTMRLAIGIASSWAASSVFESRARIDF
jgi:hypothetical protein